VFWWAGGWQRHSGNMVVKGGYSKHSKTRGGLGYGCLPACLDGYMRTHMRLRSPAACASRSALTTASSTAACIREEQSWCSCNSSQGIARRQCGSSMAG
jgi:hypothetical protein